VISGAARNAIRAAALQTSSPAAILRQLNDVLLVMADDGEHEPMFCTAVVAAVQPRGERTFVELAVGGHPSPLVLRADGSTETVGAPGSLIGVLPTPHLRDTQVLLESGDSLVLYTDGVTERHVGDRFFDEEALSSVLSRCTGFTAGVLAERVETASRAFVEDAPRDDLAIVVVRVPEVTASATSTSTELPDDLTAPQLGRRFVHAVLSALGAEHLADTATLLASELVTNAVVHGDPPLRITVETDSSSFRVCVSDCCPDEPQLQTTHLDEGGRGMFLVDRLSSRWGVIPAPAGKTVWFELRT
jgi:phosphoserine phosphatase RsbU/P